MVFLVIKHIALGYLLGFDDFTLVPQVSGNVMTTKQ
jgi:hypothetical protein